MRKHFVITAALCAFVAAPQSAMAEKGHDHGARHGGIVAEAKVLDGELVAKPDALTLYINANGKPGTTAGGKAEGTIYAGSEKTAVKFEPAGDNRFVAKGSFKTGVGIRLSVAVTLAGLAEERLSFKLK